MPEPLKNVCALCGRPPPEGAQACPDDGNTLFIEAPATAVADPLLGQQLGDYQVLSIIGEGGMGLVYRGIQPVIKKRVAIKVLRAEFASDPAQVKRLVSEAEAVNSISHRNIIDIFGLGQLPDGRHYIIMEFLDGEPLDRHLRLHAPLPALEVVELLIDICGPLFAAHSAGVIHRDLKPSNVFLVHQPDGTRYLKLLDFGLAKKGVTLDGRTSQTSQTQIAGTPDYMAPEQCRGLDISPRTDLYALGVMAFQMLTGKLPFEGPTPMDVMMLQVSGSAVAPSTVRPGVPPEVDALVLWLLKKDPEARPASAEVVRTELKRLGLQLRAGHAVHTTRTWTGEQPAFDASKYKPAVPDEGVAPAAPPEPAAAALQDAPPPRRSGLPLIAAVLGLFVATGLWVWLNGERKEPKSEPPQPTLAVEARVPVELAAPGEVFPSAPSEPGVVEPVVAKTLKHPTHDTSPSSADLTRRLELLEKKLRARTGSGGEADPSALQLLDKQRLRLTMSLSSVDRRDVSKRLDSWERTFLKR